MGRDKKVEYFKELLNTKQINNSINQLRDAAEKRGFEITYTVSENSFTLDFRINREKAKIYYKDKNKRIKDFYDRRERYHNKKPRVRLLRKRDAT